MVASLEAIERMRVQSGLLTVARLLDLSGDGSIVHDPLSVLISARVRLGTRNVFYPGVVIECDEQSECEIGDGNTLWPGTIVSASSGGTVTIGDHNVLGIGGLRILSNQPDTLIQIGDRTRLINAAELLGRSAVGDGCQIIGAIFAHSVTLFGGGDHSYADVDGRGAVLKGFGVARGLVLEVGEVVNGSGDFSAARVERQRAYHSAPGERA